jgi:hypothetical protein
MDIMRAVSQMVKVDDITRVMRLNGYKDYEIMRYLIVDRGLLRGSYGLIEGSIYHYYLSDREPEFIYIVNEKNKSSVGLHIPTLSRIMGSLSEFYCLDYMESSIEPLLKRWQAMIKK